MRHRALYVAMWLLLRLVPSDEHEPLVGDLTEEYELRAKAASSSAAFRWYLQQVGASVPPLLWARLTRAAWISTIGVAVLAYIAVGLVELTVNWAMSLLSAPGAAAYNPRELLITVPMVVLIGYVAAQLRRGAALVLAAMMLLVVIAMISWSAESMPLWYRIVYFIAGPAAAITGAALRSRRPARS
jgi:hypothetical protein